MKELLTAVAVEEVSVAKKAMGRPTLYKKDGPDVHGRISKTGGKVFEKMRRILKRQTKWPGKISDGDVVEFILRGGITP